MNVTSSDALVMSVIKVLSRDIIVLLQKVLDFHPEMKEVRNGCIPKLISLAACASFETRKELAQ